MVHFLQWTYPALIDGTDLRQLLLSKFQKFEITQVLLGCIVTQTHVFVESIKPIRRRKFGQRFLWLDGYRPTFTEHIHNSFNFRQLFKSSNAIFAEINLTEPSKIPSPDKEQNKPVGDVLRINIDKAELQTMHQKIQANGTKIVGSTALTEEISALRKLCDDILRSTPQNNKSILAAIKEDFAKSLSGRDQNVDSLQAAFFTDNLPLRLESLPYLNDKEKKELFDSLDEIADNKRADLKRKLRENGWR